MTAQPIEIVTLEPVTVAALRESVPMAEMTQFFDRAFHAVAEAVGRQGVPFAGPPVGVYFGTPTDTVDVAAGFPLAGPFEPTGDVTTLTLPAGRAAQVVHVGSYDTMVGTYDRIAAWVREQGLDVDELMWETYLTEPTPDGDPSAMRTLITWPLRG